MAGFFDVFLVAALKEGWRLLANNTLPNWQNLFPDGVPHIGTPGPGTDFATRMHTKFFPGGAADAVEFKSANAGISQRQIQVIVDVNDQGVTLQPLGFDGGNELIVKDVSQVFCCAATKEDVRVLSIAVRAIILNYFKLGYLDSIGYDSLQYVSGGQLTAAIELLPADFAGYVRVQTWSADITAQSGVFITEPVVNISGIEIAKDDIVIDDEYGQVHVDGEEEI